MPERHLHRLEIEEAGTEPPEAIRRRLGPLFGAAAVRRMTPLGLLIGRVLGPMEPKEDDVLVYASSYGESLALEEYLASFPAPSPTLFQTSIHPSAVQQVMIARRQAVGEFFPLTGGVDLGGRALRTALEVPADRRVFVCGGEERGTWLREEGIASETSFAFALELTGSAEGAMAKLEIRPGAAPAGPGLSLEGLSGRLRDRAPIRQAAGSGLELLLRWT